MKILLNNQIENYRFTVAKVVFLIIYDDYKLVQDIKDSNSMLVSNSTQDKKFYVSVFAKPNIELFEEYKNLIFYQKPNYVKNKGKTYSDANRVQVNLLNEKFEAYYEAVLRDAFFNTDKFFEKIPEKFHYIFDYYFSEAEKKISEASHLFFKYFSKNTVEQNKYDTNNGHLSFSHPKYFNDPFDCNYSLANNQDMSGRFRVLCLTNEFDNILMWSYYAENHEGCCFEYRYQDIVNEIKKLKYIGLCVYGSVNYRTKRPVQKSKVNSFSFTDLKYYIDAVFTKYKEWQHEKESRFVIISDQLIDDYLTIKTSINKVYGGCLRNGVVTINNKGKPLKIVQLVKDKNDYKLTI